MIRSKGEAGTGDIVKPSVICALSVEGCGV